MGHGFDMLPLEFIMCYAMAWCHCKIERDRRLRILDHAARHLPTSFLRRHRQCPPSCQTEGGAR